MGTGGRSKLSVLEVLLVICIHKSIEKLQDNIEMFLESSFKLGIWV